MTAETFGFMDDDLSTSDLAKNLQERLASKLDEFCPLTSFKLSSQDKAWINPELKALKRKRMREYQKQGKSEKYKKLEKEFKLKLKTVAEKYLQKKLDALK